jgi:DNA-binding NtrC family response regulator
MGGKIIKIAVIDDEPSILEMIETYLHRTSGFEVSTFSAPQSAIGSIDASYDVVLLDIMMPSLSGLDVLKTLREKAPELIIIMMTAYSTLDKVLKSHREGATHYIMKPFSSMKALEEKIYELVQK